jgi:hypothetical protein
MFPRSIHKCLSLTGRLSLPPSPRSLTDERIELDEYTMDALRDRLQMIADRLEENPEITVTYFQPDAKKEGGAYITAAGTVKKIDEYEQAVVMTHGMAIPFDEIVSIEGPMFEVIDDE